MQRPAPEQHRDEKPVRPQRPPCLHQLPDRIACPVQRKRVDDKIMRALVERQHRIVRHDPRALQPPLPHTGKTRHDGGRRKGSVNLAQSFLDLVGDLFVQEQLRPLPQGAVAPGEKRPAIGQVGRMGHDGRN